MVGVGVEVGVEVGVDGLYPKQVRFPIAYRVEVRQVLVGIVQRW